MSHSSCKLNKTLVDKVSKFYNTSMKSWLEDNYVEMHLVHNEGKFIAAKYMTLISKNVYIDKLDDIVNKYNHAYQNEAC